MFNLRRFALVLLVLILILTGSYIRVRSVEDAESADWLVLAQIAICLLAGLAGLLLIKKHYTSGNSSRLLLVYCAGVIASALFSGYPVLVAGYWILLAGMSLLLIGLISSSSDEASLRHIEFVMLATLAGIVLKDSLISWFLVPQAEWETMFRLGENTVSANGLAMMAAMGLSMSIGPSSANGRKWRYGWRALLFTALLLTRSRIALFGLVLGWLARTWYGRGFSTDSRSRILAAAIPCWAGCMLLLAALAWTMEAKPVTAMVEVVNRNEDADSLTSVTGRTEIWGYAIERVFDGPQSIAFGHGYGVSRFVLNENNRAADFYAYHSHNTLLESLVSVGVAGTIPFLLLFAAGLRWFVNFSRLREAFSSDFILRAIAVMALILTSMLTESDLVNKIGPVTIVFLFYALALDREAIFRRRAYEQ